MSKKMISLKSSDGESFEIEEAVAIQSETIKHLIEDDCANNEIPLAIVKSETLAKVIEYCKKHVEVDDGGDSASNDETKKEEIKKWDDDFMKKDLDTLFDILLAANYLNVKNLLDLTCQTIADMIKDKSPEEIRTIFKIVNDFTAEEEAKIRQENAWAFE